MEELDDDEMEEFEWYEEESVNTTGLHIPPRTALEYGTPVFNADEIPSEWELFE